MDTRHRKKYLWSSVAASMAVVVGFWGASLKTRLSEPIAPAAGDALEQAFDEFRKNSVEFRTQSAAELPSSAPEQATSTDSAALKELKQRVIEYAR